MELMSAFPPAAWQAIGAAVLLFIIAIVVITKVADILKEDLAEKREDFRKEMEYEQERHQEMLDFERERNVRDRDEEMRRWQVIIGVMEKERELFQQLVDNSGMQTGLLSRIELKVDGIGVGVANLQKDISEVRIRLARP
jgi:hypothetical protein